MADRLLELLTHAAGDLFEVGFAELEGDLPSLAAESESTLRRAWGVFHATLLDFLETGDEAAVQRWATTETAAGSWRGYTLIDGLGSFDLFGRLMRSVLFSQRLDRSELLEDLERMDHAIAALRKARIMAQWSEQQRKLETLDRKVSASEARFERLVEGAPAAIATTDLEGTITYVSGRCIQMYGTDDADALLGRSALELLAAKDRERAARNLSLTLEVGTLDSEPYEFVRADGSTYPGELSAAVLRDDTGEPTGFVAAVADVSRRRRAEAAISRYQHRLRRLTTERALVEERERRRIASELHDEVGQALAMVKMTVETQRGELPADSDVARALGELTPILAEAIRGTRSLTWALASPLLHEVGLSAAIEALTEQMAEKHHLEIAYEDLGLGDVTPNADAATLVFQSIRELLLNVVKHAEASRVQVTASAGAETAEIQVEDDGKGFDPRAVDLHSLEEQRFGLFAIHERVGLMGGRLSIRSCAGRGTSASLGFPLEPVDGVNR